MLTMAEPKRVFLTGATGLLGAYVLDELLRTGASEVRCLVRSTEASSAAERLRSHLQRLGLEAAALDERVVAVAGDLREPRFGLPPAEHAALAERLDAIVHAGASVDFLRPLAGLQSANVDGTARVLELASAGRGIAVHHVSSLAVFFGRPGVDHGVVSELDDPPEQDLRNGYAQSKLAAERLVLAARGEGVPSAIYRTARIGGHSRTGATSNLQDLVALVLKACILLGAYPTWDIDVAMVPVDYVSRAIVHLCRQERSIGRAFHLFHPRPIAWEELVQLVVEQGHPMVPLAHEPWRERLKQVARSSHPERESLARLWMLLAGAHGLFVVRPRYETPCSDEGLAGSGIECPPIDAQLVATYLAFFRVHGFIPAPLV